MRLVESEGPSTIYRQNRARYIQISADVSASGHGLAKAIQDVKDNFDTGRIKLPPGVSYSFFGSAQDFQDLIASITLALVLAVAFIFLVLSSLMNRFLCHLRSCWFSPLPLAEPYDLWKSRGAEFITPPIPKYGEIRCYIRDPDGYIIEVGQSTDLKYG